MRFTEQIFILFSSTSSDSLQSNSQWNGRTWSNQLECWCLTRIHIFCWVYCWTIKRSSKTKCKQCHKININYQCKDLEICEKISHMFKVFACGSSRLRFTDNCTLWTANRINYAMNSKLRKFYNFANKSTLKFRAINQICFKP